MSTSRARATALALTLALAACDAPVTEPVSEATAVEAELGLMGAHARPDFTLTILHSNDGESVLLPGTQFGGVGRFARTVDELREVASSDCDPKCGVILVSSGDNFLAGPQFSASLATGVPFFDAKAQDLIGFDAFAIGNHEFDFGPDVLADYIESFTETSPPFLSANLDVGAEPRLAALQSEKRIARSSVVDIPLWERHERGKGRGHDQGRHRAVARIGIIGATTPNLALISSPRNVEVRQDVAHAINVEAAGLRLRGVDMIVLISHLQSVTEDLAIVPLLEGIDVAVAGGGDELLANADDILIPGDQGLVFGPYPLVATDRRGRQVPVITTSGQYRYVGRLDVDFSRFGGVLSYEGGPVRVEGSADPEIVAAVEAPVQAAVAALQASIVGTSQVELDGRRSRVRTVETNEGNLIADALRWQASDLATSFGVPVPDVSLQNGGGIRNDAIFPAGNITEFNTFSFVPFANFVAVVPNVSRDRFKQLLERAVSGVEAVAGQFAQVSGFSFTWNPAGIAQTVDASGGITREGTRIVDVTLDGGEPIVVGGVVQAGPPITVATIDFLARGGDGYPYQGSPFTTVGVTYQQALSNFIQDGLEGTVTAADYPLAGEGRITRLGS
jgi:5'-nucleotidase